MTKKISITVISLLLFANILLSFYSIFQSDKKQVKSAAVETTITLEYESLHDYLINSGEASTHYLFFCSSTNQDCQYIENTVLKSIESKDPTALSYIEWVDITELEKNFTTIRLKDEWGINNYPAFVSVTIKDKSVTVNNMLQYNSENPMSVQDIKMWMINNKIWSGLIEQGDQQIIVPK